HDLNNTGIYLLDSDDVGGLPDTLPPRGTVTCVTDPLNLTPGRCYVSVQLARGGIMTDSIEHAGRFDMEDDAFFASGKMPERSEVLCVVRHAWSAG
ncbi:MAG: ABC transporter ATP-binding protein, partial [Tepidisphaeraceae bacterium]